MESRLRTKNPKTSSVEKKLDKLANDIKKLPKERVQRLEYLMERKAVSVKEAAEMLGVSTVTVRRAVKSGRLKVFRMGTSGPFRIAIEEIEKLMKGESPENEK